MMDDVPSVPARYSAEPLRSLLDRFIRPRTIALVGATERSIWSVAAHDNLVRFGFAGRIIPVNPKGGLIHGLPAATSCAAAGESIDAALLMVPASVLLETIEDLRSAGVAGAVLLSSGFAEMGSAGAAQQAELAEAARKSGIRLLGPNCLGFVNYVDGTPLWTTPLRRPTPGPTFALVSQSGALAAHLEQSAHQQSIGLTHIISTGNEADVDVADAIDYLAASSPARAIALFLETVRHPTRFAEAVAYADSVAKPVIVLKVGSSEAAAQAAQAHTGSLVGNDRVFDALCRQLGMTRVRSLEELVVTADLFARLGPVARPGLGLIAMSGGLGEIATDQAESEGTRIPPLASSTTAALRETLPAFATPNNPLDLTGAAMLEPDLITRAMEVTSRDPEVGLIAYVFDPPVRKDKLGFAEKFMRAIGAGAKASAKPSLMLSATFSPVSRETRALAEDNGIIYSGGGLRHVLRAVGQLCRWSARRGRSNVPLATVSRVITQPRTEREVLNHLAAFGLDVIPGPVVGSADEAVAAARKIGGPVVLKIASPNILHKTEVGGVALKLVGDDAVRTAHDALRSRVAAVRPDARIDGVIVSPMRTDGVELFVGTMRDPQYGAAIAVGLGGVFVEVLKDTSLRLLPVTEQDALEMLDELRGRAILDGFRGAPGVNRQAAARAIVAIGNAALALAPNLVSLEVNPLLAWDDQIEALDGVTVWDGEREQA
jgi:acetate---CoA ligase (ADP-forming)